MNATAKRGDLVVIPHKSTTHYLTGRGPDHRTDFYLAIVTSVTREGIIKAARSKTADYDNFRRDRNQIPGGVLIAHASRFRVPSKTVLASVDEEYRTSEAVKSALTPFLAIGGSP